MAFPTKFHKRPQGMDEFGCWLNTWADNQKYQPAEGERFRLGYEQAISDVYREFNRMWPEWMRGWKEWIR